MDIQQNAPEQSAFTPSSPFEGGNNAIKFNSWMYGTYALFLLIECIDFLALLHTKEPGYNATYTIVHVSFFIVELIFCTAITLGLLLLLIAKEKAAITAIAVLLIIALFRSGLIYYLYWQTEPKVHFIPYIYKKANALSGIMRSIFLPLQVISGLIATWSWIKIARKLKVH